jgi:SH3-like domain-containing protein
MPISRIFPVLILTALAVAIVVPLLVAAEAAQSPKSTAEVKTKSPADHPGASGLPVPRFVSLSSDTVNMRAGPGVRYPITWVYRRKGIPLMVMAEFEYWRKVRDGEGAEGWMHSALLRGRRMALLQGGINELRPSPETTAPVVLRAQAGVIGQLLSCGGPWCQIILNDMRVWLPRTGLFGALPNEEFP